MGWDASLAEQELDKFNRLVRVITRCDDGIQAAIAAKDLINITRQKELLSTYIEDLELTDESLLPEESKPTLQNLLKRMSAKDRDGQRINLICRHWKRNS
ncbi:hypothetical protein U1Q18_044858 [Sarracenia purpurea var. burkii]